jgi:AcrR family transcriptional regulator
VIDGYGQSDRILSAVTRLAADEGFADLTVSKIRRQAGVSRQDFDARFDDVADCFLAAVESLARAAAVRADSWAGDTGKSGNRIYRTMLAISALVARNQDLARLVLEEILAPGRGGLQLREQLISEAAHRLLGNPATARSQGAIATEASVAAVWRITQREITDGRASRLPRSAPFLALLVDLARRDRKHRIQKFD